MLKIILFTIAAIVIFIVVIAVGFLFWCANDAESEAEEEQKRLMALRGHE
jgi:flagellar basal body-associated protein FliL